MPRENYFIKPFIIFEKGVLVSAHELIGHAIHAGKNINHDCWRIDDYNARRTVYWCPSIPRTPMAGRYVKVIKSA